MVLAILGTLAIVGVVVGVGLWVDRRVKSTFLPRAEDLEAAQRKQLPGAEPHEPATAPQSALRSDPVQMQRVIDRQRCTCAGKPALRADGEDDVRYGDKLLRVVRLRCDACGAGRSLYFEPRST